MTSPSKEISNTWQEKLLLSPFLNGLKERYPAFTEQISKTSPKPILTDILQEVKAVSFEEEEDIFRKTLRIARQKVALLVAYHDLTGNWGVKEVTETLSTFADVCVQATVDFLLRKAHRAGTLLLPDYSQPGLGGGYIVLAMGKHGAQELNYSSDIDLIALFDQQTSVLSPSFEPSLFYVRLTKQLVSILQDQTAESYVFRVDLRLRPDPLATQICLSLDAAGIYYETVGQNWERAAMIKARAIAGDIPQGEAFLKRLQPYVWRKYLDFAAISDIQSLKRQIHATRSVAEETVLGRNIKLSPGGIRQIEFFVQTQQLIAGGKQPSLRGRKTLDMLEELARLRWISDKTCADLQGAYVFLRTIEHRLQMLQDEQTQTLPSNEQAFEKFSRFCGFSSASDLTHALRQTFLCVIENDAALFEKSPELGVGKGSLVFTGGEDDPETLETLKKMGFKNAPSISTMIRGWHFSHYKATQSARARALLTELMPKLLEVFSKMPDPDAAFLAFDRFLRDLPAGIQVFSLFRANPHLLEFLVEILGISPHLHQMLSRKVRIFDAVLSGGFFEALPTREDLEKTCAQIVEEEQKEGFERTIDRLRVFGQEQIFRVSARFLTQVFGSFQASAAYSLLAEVLVGAALQAVRFEMERRYGGFPESRVAVVALGRLGSFEMTATSDLDLIVIYECLEEVTPGGLSPQAYFTKLTQRLVAALSAQTGEGILYEIDLRLRPSGSKGPLATSLARFEAYHRQEAWVWEKLSLVSARVVAGDPDFCPKVTKALRESLGCWKSEEKIWQEVSELKERIRQEFPAPAPWEIKHCEGGSLDLQLFVETLVLLYPNVLREVKEEGKAQPETLGILEKLAEKGVISQEKAGVLKQAHQLYHAVLSTLAVTVGKNTSEETFFPNLNNRLMAIFDAPSLDAARAQLEALKAQVKMEIER